MGPRIHVIRFSIPTVGAAAAAVFVCAILARVVVVAAQQPPTFRSGPAVVVPVFATVTDAQKRLVPSLTEADFEILDDDRPQALTLFESTIQPLTVIVMLDTSASMTGTIPLLRAAAEQFLLRLLPADRARVGAFNDKIQLSAPFTSDRDELVGDLKDLDYGNSTKLYDALVLSLDELKPVAGRRVILVFTDGDDTASRAGLGTVIERARAEEAMVYAVGLESNYFDGRRMVRSRPDRGLRKLADETGGGYFELTKTQELAPTFTRVAQELHSQYVLGFTPAQLDNRVHKLTVRVRQPGMTARARRSYVAAPLKSSMSAQE